MRELALELFKLRRKRLFLIIALFLLVQLAWAFASVSISLSRHPEQPDWEALLVTVAAMNGLFLPILIAVSVSRIWDMEHKGRTWNMLLTLSVKPSRLYAAKYVCASLVMLWVGLLQVLAITGFGLSQGFRQPIPFGLMAHFLVGSLLTSIVIIALQHWVSMAVKNQAFALSLGMIGGFFGLTADLFPSEISRIFIWSYYSALSPVRQKLAHDQIHYMIQDLGSLWPALAFLVGTGMAIYLAGRFHMVRKEV